MLGEIAVVATALGVGGILTKLIDRLMDRRKGHLEQEQSAWEARDAEAEFRRRNQETLHETRRGWHMDTGKPYDQMPPVPVRTKT